MPRVAWPNHRLGLPGLVDGVRPQAPLAGGMMSGWMTVLTSRDGMYGC